MGKGGTKFVGDAVGVRPKRPKTVYTGKEMRANMEQFKETGRHPEIETALQERRESAPGLPLYDLNRQHVFLDISIGNKPAGRIIVELFDDIVPAAAGHFRNRCQTGAVDHLTGSEWHKLVPYYAIFGGRSPKVREPMHMPHNSRLTTQEPGCVLVSLDGLSVAISLDKATNMDEAYQVVGRIHMGREVIEKLNNVETAPPDDVPVQRVVVTRCGPTNHLGVVDDSDVVAETKEAAAARARKESVDARSAVLEALEVGLQSHKRKLDTSAPGPSGSNTLGGDGSGAGPGAGPAAAPQGGPSGAGGSVAVIQSGQGGAAKGLGAVRDARAKVLDSMLGPLSSDSSEEEQGASG